MPVPNAVQVDPLGMSSFDACLVQSRIKLEFQIGLNQRRQSKVWCGRISTEPIERIDAKGVSSSPMTSPLGNK